MTRLLSVVAEQSKDTPTVCSGGTVITRLLSAVVEQSEDTPTVCSSGTECGKHERHVYCPPVIQFMLAKTMQRKLQIGNFCLEALNRIFSQGKCNWTQN